MAELAGHDPPPGIIVVVDGLDEAGSDEDLREMRQLLRELARLGAIRVVVATRPLASGDRFRPGSHLHALGAGGAGSPNLIDLDDDRYFEIGDLVAFAGGMLCQAGADKPRPPDAAWSSYRDEPDTTQALAQVIAERAGRNYLVAAMAAFDLSERSETVDPTAPGFDPDSIPSAVGEALEGFLLRLDDDVREQTRGLLTALAYARGRGLDDDRWRRFVDALGFGAVTGPDLTLLRRSGAADYLLESKAESGQAVTRLFHQALADELRVGRSAEADESRLLDLIVDEGRRDGWIAAPAYLRRHAADHAAAAGRLDELVADPTFIVAADPQTLLPGLARLSAEHPLPGIYRLARELLSDDAATNAAVLELVARMQREAGVADALAGVQAVERPFAPIAAVCRPLAVAAAEFAGHTAELTSIARARWPGVPHDVVVTASADGTVRVWDPLRTDAELTRIEYGSELLGMAATQWPGSDFPRLAVWSVDDKLSVWDAAEPGRPVASYERLGVSAATWIALEEPDTPVLALGFAQGAVGILDPLQDEEPRAVVHMHQAYVYAIARLRWPGIDHDILVTGAKDTSMELWDPLGVTELPGSHATSQVMGLTGVERADGSWYVAACTRNSRCDVWDPQAGEAFSLTGHTNAVLAAAEIPWPRRKDPVLATVSADETTRLWDVADGSELLRFEGHTDATVGVVALETYPERETVIATASDDGTARLWDQRALARAGQPFAGHHAAIQGITVVDDPGRSRRLLITTSLDRSARVWELDRPGVEIGRFEGHDAWVWDVTSVAAADGRLLAVSVGGDGMGRVWDPDQPADEIGRFEMHKGPCWGITTLKLPDLDHDLVVSCSTDRTARVWDPLSPDRELARFEGHDQSVWQATTVVWPGLAHPVVVSTSLDDTARVWDPRDGSELGRFDGHSDSVRAVTTLRWPGIDHDVVVTTSYDGTARIWDPLAPAEALAVYTGHEAALNCVTTVTRPGGGEPRIATASLDGTVRIWEPTEPERTLLTIGLLVRATRCARWPRAG